MKKKINKISTITAANRSIKYILARLFIEIYFVHAKKKRKSRCKVRLSTKVNNSFRHFWQNVL